MQLATGVTNIITAIRRVGHSFATLMSYPGRAYWCGRRKRHPYIDKSHQNNPLEEVIRLFVL